MSDEFISLRWRQNFITKVFIEILVEILREIFFGAVDDLDWNLEQGKNKQFISIDSKFPPLVLLFRSLHFSNL